MVKLQAADKDSIYIPISLLTIFRMDTTMNQDEGATTKFKLASILLSIFFSCAVYFSVHMPNLLNDAIKFEDGAYQRFYTSAAEMNHYCEKMLPQDLQAQYEFSYEKNLNKAYSSEEFKHAYNRMNEICWPSIIEADKLKFKQSRAQFLSSKHAMSLNGDLVEYYLEIIRVTAMVGWLSFFLLIGTFLWWLSIYLQLFKHRKKRHDKKALLL